MGVVSMIAKGKLMSEALLNPGMQYTNVQCNTVVVSLLISVCTQRDGAVQSVAEQCIVHCPIQCAAQCSSYAVQYQPQPLHYNPTIPRKMQYPQRAQIIP